MNIDAVIAQSMPQFKRIAAANELVKWEEESQFALQAVMRNEKLRECAPHTVQDAIINVAAVGLTLNPAHGYAYLVPEWDKPSGSTHCHLRISFKGLLKIATDTGVVSWVVADVVKENDQFTANGKWALPTHVFDPFADRGKSVGVYCAAKLASGDFVVEFAPWSEVEKARAAAKTHYVWDKWPDEMAKKFIIKRASKQWPRSDGSERLSTAVHVVNQSEGSEDTLAKLEKYATTMIEHITNDEPDAVLECWAELNEEERSSIWTAKTKGGWFTQDEKSYIRKAQHAAYEAKQPDAAA